MVYKLIKIYDLTLKEKKIQLKLKGTSEYWIEAIPEAVAIIPHTFLDNAIKYTPRDLDYTIEVYINDEKDFIDFRVTSYGPLIEQNEFSKIFQLGYRGIYARRLHEGTGFGLYLSQFIAVEHLKSIIKVEQVTIPDSHGNYKTTFSVEIPVDNRS